MKKVKWSGIRLSMTSISVRMPRARNASGRRRSNGLVVLPADHIPNVLHAEVDAGSLAAHADFLHDAPGADVVGNGDGENAFQAQIDKSKADARSRGFSAH